MTEQAPSPAFYDRFVLLIAGLRQIVSSHFGRDRAQWPMMVVVSNAIGRRLARLDALVARFRAGRLPAPRPPGAGKLGAVETVARRKRASRSDADAPALPRGRGWLARKMTGVWVPRLGNVATYAETVRILLEDPEIHALLAASPQAGRLLRPLWHMVSLDPLPDVLRRVAAPAAESQPEVACSGATAGPPAREPPAAAARPVGRASWHTRPRRGRGIAFSPA